MRQAVRPNRMHIALFLKDTFIRKIEKNCVHDEIKIEPGQSFAFGTRKSDQSIYSMTMGV
jgi:hypothetical protein